MSHKNKIETMDRPAVHAAVADYFRTPVADVDQAFTYKHTDALRSTLQTVWQGRHAERGYMLAGAGVTAAAALTLGAPLVCLAFGAAATWGGRALMQRSRHQLEDSMVACIQARKARAASAARLD